MQVTILCTGSEINHWRCCRVSIAPTQKLLCHPHTVRPDPRLAVHCGPTAVKLLNFAGAHFFSSSPMGKLQHFRCCNHTIIELVLFLFLLPLKLITGILVNPLKHLLLQLQKIFKCPIFWCFKRLSFHFVTRSIEGKECSWPTPLQSMHTLCIKAFSLLPLKRSGQAGPHSQTSQPLLLHRALSLDTVHPLTHTHPYRGHTAIDTHMGGTQQVSQIKTGTEALVFPGLSEWLPLHGGLFHIPPPPPASLISSSSTHLSKAGRSHSALSTHIDVNTLSTWRI